MSVYAILGLGTFAHAYCVVFFLQSNVVTRFQPRWRSFEDALSAFRVAEFDECLGVLSQHEGFGGDALRARCLIRMGRSSEALDLLQSSNFGDLSHRCAAELLIIQLTACLAIGDADGASTAMRDAKARSYGVGSLELESELLYLCALYEWTQGKYAEARALAEKLLANRSDIPHWLREDLDRYPFNQGYWRVRTYELLGMTAALEADYTSQAKFLKKAFEEFDAALCEDAFIEASMLNNLAVLVRDLQDPGLTGFVRDRFTLIKWNRNLGVGRFLVQHAIGWYSALGGDHLGGLREFRNSAEIAPSVPLRILAILDRAFIAGQLSERFSALEQMDHAYQLAATVDWDSVISYERMVLLNLAMTMAAYDPVRARTMLDRYVGTRGPVSNLTMFTSDTRRRGDECMAIGAVVRAEGQLDRATMVYKEAFDIWTDVGYAWKAAAAALEIYTLTGDTAYLDVVAREAEERPRSWIASRYAAIVLEDPRSFVRA